MKSQIDFTDITETNEEFWVDAKLIQPVQVRLSEENYNFLLEMNKPFEIALNDIIDVHRELYELAKSKLTDSKKQLNIKHIIF